MKNKNTLIIVLLIVGAVLFSIVQFKVLPAQNEKSEQYQLAQLDAATHDLSSILSYQNRYMGNASNTINLIRHLPLTAANMDFELLSDQLTLQINYNDTRTNVALESLNNKSTTLPNIDKEREELYLCEVEKSLVYNSTAAFGLIDNLEHIIYSFTDISYNVSRTNITAFYDNFPTILEDTRWNQEVQVPLTDSNYIAAAAKKILIVQ